MQDNERKPSETDAQPDAGNPKPEPVAPGKAPKLSEADAKPDSPSSNASGGSRS